MSRPAICVVVPVYRSEATLDRCVESILSQTVEGGVRCILVAAPTAAVPCVMSGPHGMTACR